MVPAVRVVPPACEIEPAPKMPPCRLRVPVAPKVTLLWKKIESIKMLTVLVVPVITPMVEAPLPWILRLCEPRFVVLAEFV